jgi:hypothetical protein
MSRLCVYIAHCSTKVISYYFVYIVINVSVPHAQSNGVLTNEIEKLFSAHWSLIFSKPYRKNYKSDTDYRLIYCFINISTI